MMKWMIVSLAVWTACSSGTRPVAPAPPPAEPAAPVAAAPPPAAPPAADPPRRSEPADRPMVRQLRQRLDNAKFEEWLMPVNQFGGVPLRLPQLASQLQFSSVKDYEDYVTRLTTIPQVFDQTVVVMKRGIEKRL